MSGKVMAITRETLFAAMLVVLALGIYSIVATAWVVRKVRGDRYG